MGRKRKNFPRSYPGYVYLIRSVLGIYKIGRTKYPDERMKSIYNKYGAMEVVQIIKTPECTLLEKALHERFAEKRVRDEWFALDPHDVEYIKGLAS